MPRSLIPEWRIPERLPHGMSSRSMIPALHIHLISVTELKSLLRACQLPRVAINSSSTSVERREILPSFVS